MVNIMIVEGAWSFELEWPFSWLLVKFNETLMTIMYIIHIITMDWWNCTILYLAKVITVHTCTLLNVTFISFIYDQLISTVPYIPTKTVMTQLFYNTQGYCMTSWGAHLIVKYAAISIVSNMKQFWKKIDQSINQSKKLYST